MKRTRLTAAPRRAPIPRVTQEEYEALAAFRYALRRFLHFSDTAAVAAGVTPQQHQALLALVGYPGGGPISVGILAERLQRGKCAIFGGRVEAWAGIEPALTDLQSAT